MYMFCCPKCQKFFKNENKDSVCRCGICKGNLVPLKVTDTVWNVMNKEEKRDIIGMAIKTAKQPKTDSVTMLSGNAESEQKTNQNSIEKEVEQSTLNTNIYENKTSAIDVDNNRDLSDLHYKNNISDGISRTLNTMESASAETPNKNTSEQISSQKRSSFFSDDFLEHGNEDLISGNQETFVKESQNISKSNRYSNKKSNIKKEWIFIGIIIGIAFCVLMVLGVIKHNRKEVENKGQVTDSTVAEQSSNGTGTIKEKAEKNNETSSSGANNDSTEGTKESNSKPTSPKKNEEVSVEITSKKNYEVDYDQSRYSPFVSLGCKVTNKTNRTIKGVQGELIIKDLFGEQIMLLGLDFTGKDIPPNEYVTFDDYGFEVNQFIDSHTKVYNTAYSDLQFEYEAKNIVYGDGTAKNEISKGNSSDAKKNNDVIVTVTKKINHQADYDVGLYSPFVEFAFSIKNNTNQSIRGVQGVLDIQDLFGVTIKKLQCDFTGKTINPGATVTFDEIGFEVNQFMDEDVKIWNEDFKDLKFEYEVTKTVK